MSRSVVIRCVVLFFVFGCSQERSPIDTSVVDQRKARDFADTVVADVIQGRTDSIHSKMETSFRQAVTQEQLPKMLEQMYATYGGKPLEAEFKASESGIKIFSNGDKKPVNKSWYSLRTTEHQKGTHFMFVEVVPEGDELKCCSFSIVTFPLGAPPLLK